MGKNIVVISASPLKKSVYTIKTSVFAGAVFPAKKQDAAQSKTTQTPLLKK